MRLLKRAFLYSAFFSDKTVEVCSGLEVQNYCEASLNALFETGYDCLEQVRQDYMMPSGALREYLWSVYRKS